MGETMIKRNTLGGIAGALFCVLAGSCMILLSDPHYPTVPQIIGSLGLCGLFGSFFGAFLASI
jgi:hypothetical protein